MATLTDLIRQNKPALANMSGVWYARIVAPEVVGLNDFVWVEIPDIDSSLKFGPCRWPRSDSPDLGKEALVVFDNRQQPWVIGIW